eukprot:15365551-Ditylum_brightwellii.AAC.1
MAVYHLVREEVAVGVILGQNTVDAAAWQNWSTFCEWICILLDLAGIHHPIPFLQLFAFYIPHGTLVAKGRAIQKCQVEQYLQSEVQIYNSMGALTHN